MASKDDISKISEEFKETLEDFRKYLSSVYFDGVDKIPIPVVGLMHKQDDFFDNR